MATWRKRLETASTRIAELEARKTESEAELDAARSAPAEIAARKDKLADAIAGKQNVTGTTSTDMLKHIHLQQLPSEMRASQDFYDSMQEAADQGKKVNKKVFKYVDLLKDCAPYYG